MAEYYRIIGIDVGKKRIGLAQSDLSRTLASPIGAFAPAEIFSELKKRISGENVRKFIVGWPITLKGEEKESVHMVRSFIGELKKQFPDIEVVTLDERFTSVMAQQAILDSGVSKKKRQQKGIVDAVAAAILLQNYLDQKNI